MGHSSSFMIGPPSLLIISAKPGGLHWSEPRGAKEAFTPDSCLVARDGRSSLLGFGFFLTASRRIAFSQLLRVSTMAAKSQRPKKGRDRILSTLNVAIDGLNLAKEFTSGTPAPAVCGTVSVLLTMIRVRFHLSYEISHVHTYPGLDGERSGLRRARAILCSYLQGP